MKKIFFYSCIMLMMVISFNCPNPGNNPDTPEKTPVPGPLEPAEVILSGCVRSGKDNVPVDGAEITFQYRRTQTNFRGNFSIIVTNPAAGGQLLIDKQGFAHYQKAHAEILNSVVNLEIYLKPVDISKEIVLDKAGGNTITALDGASITLPEISGQISEPLIVSLASYDVSTDDIHSAPGDFSGIASTGEDVMIISMGMLDVSITGKESGTDYSLSGLGSYEIVIPISGDYSKATPTIPMWYFDESLGKWIEEGEMVLERNCYIGTVTHFTTWNADFKADALTCITGNIIDINPDRSYQLTLMFPGFSAIYYESENSFSVINLPQATKMMLQVQNLNSGRLWFKTFTTNSSEDCYFVGDFLDDSNYVPNVDGLWVQVENRNLIVSWTGEPSAIDYIEVSCTNTDDGTTFTTIVSAGEMNMVVSDLDDGLYEVKVIVVDGNGDKSYGKQKTIRMADPLHVTLSITNYTETPALVYYAENDSMEFILYEAPLQYPPEPGLTSITFMVDMGEGTGEFSFKWTEHDYYRESFGSPKTLNGFHYGEGLEYSNIYIELEIQYFE